MSQSSTLFIGMDVHKDTIAVAYVAQGHGAEVARSALLYRRLSPGNCDLFLRTILLTERRRQEESHVLRKCRPIAERLPTKCRVQTGGCGVMKRVDVLDWIDTNRLGRRNLTLARASPLRGRRYNRGARVETFRVFKMRFPKPRR
jgi:hypothetical protein